MEPKSPAYIPSPEKGGYGQQELPKQLENRPATFVERAQELPAQKEIEPTGGTIQAAPALPTPQPQVAQDTFQKPVLNPVPVVDDNPAMAADEDVIEKEWVDKAKKIILQTKDDPHKQEQEVSKLQADYLKKRYGKNIKVADDA